MTNQSQTTASAEMVLAVQQKVEDFKAIVSSAPEALTANMTMLEKAIAAGAALLARIEAGEMDDNMDAEINDHVAKLDKAYELANSKRTPFTRMMDDFKSQFTGIEKSFKDEKEVFQKIRNSYAMKKKQEEAERQRLAALKLAQDKERIELRSQLEQEQENEFGSYLKFKREELFTSFNRLTLDNFKKGAAWFKSYKAEFPREKFDTWQSFKGSKTGITDEEINKMIAELKSAERFEKFKQEFITQIAESLSVLIDRLPGKKKELEDQKKAAEEAERARQEAERLAAEAKSAAEKEAAEKARIAAEEAAEKAEQERLIQAAREKEEAEARAKAEAEAEAKRKQEAEVKKEAEITNMLFDAEMRNATEGADIPKGRDSYEITVNAPPGIMLLFNQWFQNEGKGLTVDQILKKKLDSIVTWCEKFAHKNQSQKIDSPFITYTEKFSVKTEK